MLKGSADDVRRAILTGTLNLRHLACGIFFMFLAGMSSGFFIYAMVAGPALVAWLQLACTLIMGFLGWYTIKLTFEKMRTPVLVESRGGDDRGPDASGLVGAGKLAPIKPQPPHHLVAMKDLPPGDRTNSVPRD